MSPLPLFPRRDDVSTKSSLDHKSRLLYLQVCVFLNGRQLLVSSLWPLNGEPGRIAAVHLRQSINKYRNCVSEGPNFFAGTI